MYNKKRNLIWKLYLFKQKKLLTWGLKNGLIATYDDNLIKSLRNIYYGGVPASIILLSDTFSNGFCYDRALLLARNFLDDDIKLIYASVDSIKLNPKNNNKIHLYDDHCILERITKDGKHLIYDTSQGLIYDRDLYWLIERPKIRKTNDKKSIIEFLKEEDSLHPQNIEEDKFLTLIILPFIEKCFDRPNEMYAAEGIELLQREINHYKKLINYENINNKIKSKHL